MSVAALFRLIISPFLHRVKEYDDVHTEKKVKKKQDEKMKKSRIKRMKTKPSVQICIEKY